MENSGLVCLLVHGPYYFPFGHPFNTKSLNKWSKSRFSSDLESRISLGPLFDLDGVICFYQTFIQNQPQTHVFRDKALVELWLYSNPGPRVIKAVSRTMKYIYEASYCFNQGTVKDTTRPANIVGCAWFVEHGFNVVICTHHPQHGYSYITQTIQDDIWPSSEEGWNVGRGAIQTHLRQTVWWRW